MNALISFLKFLFLDNAESAQKEMVNINKSTKENVKEVNLSEANIKEIYKLEAKENDNNAIDFSNIPLEETTTQIVTETKGNEIIQKEIIVKKTCNGYSIKQTTTTNTLNKTLKR